MKRLFVLAVLAILSIVSIPAKAELYNLVNLREEEGEVGVPDGWELCGNYFTTKGSAKSGSIRLIYNVEGKNGPFSVPSYTQKDSIKITFDEEADPPKILFIQVYGIKFLDIRIRLREYLNSPCILKGTRI